MSNKFLTGFKDNATNEEGFQVIINERPNTNIKYIGNSALVINGELPSDIPTNSTEEGHNIEVIAENTPAGNLEVKVAGFNQLGLSDAVSLGSVEVYNRTDFIIYIGDEQVIGENHLDELSEVSGKRAQTLDSLIQGAIVHTNIKSSTYRTGSWQDAAPRNADTHGAEVSLIDGLSSGQERKIAVWKLGVPNATASTKFSITGDGLEFIQNNVKNHFDELMGLYHQARIRAVIINMPLEDGSIVNAYQSLIDWFRDHFEHPELPIVLTDTSGQPTDTMKNISFQIEKTDGYVGDYYEMRGLLGYYRQPTHAGYPYNRPSYKWDRIMDSNLNELPDASSALGGGGSIIQQVGYLQPESADAYLYDDSPWYVWGQLISEHGTDLDGNIIWAKNLEESAADLGITKKALSDALFNIGGSPIDVPGDRSQMGQVVIRNLLDLAFTPYTYAHHTTQYYEDIEGYLVTSDGTETKVFPQ